jgi:hypothetical protein
MTSYRRPCVLVGTAILFGLCRGICAQDSPSSSSNVQSAVRDGSHDFDFLYGDWVMQNRRLKGKPFTGAKDWVAFASTDHCQALPGGLGNQDFFRTDEFFGKDFVGMTIRLYDRQTGLWRLYWIDNKNSHGDVGQPNIGRFDGNVGIFDEHYTLDGKPAIDRYTWTKYGENSKVTAHFEESISQDEGKTWEVVFSNDFFRAD